MELTGEGKLQSIPITEVKETGDVTCFMDLYNMGFVAYTLGPVYVYAGVEESIPDRFNAEGIDGAAGKVMGGTRDFGHVVIARCEKWNMTIEFMDRQSYPYFQRWMLAQMFVNKAKDNVYVPRRFLAPLFDPFALERGKQIPTVLETWSVSSMKSLIRPVCEIDPKDTKAYIDLITKPPEEEVVLLGKNILASIGG